MHVRTSTKNTNGKVYQYVQIVQSVRRGGRSTQEVLGNLGSLPEQTVSNLKLALQASRENRAIIVAPDSPGLTDRTKVEANLRFLDLAVMLDTWRGLGMDKLLAELCPSDGTNISTADVITVLVLQRCVAPGSKLYAQRWVPTTALPELLDFPVDGFNNTRIHRVLDALHAATAELQNRLPLLYRQKGASPTAFFVDVTDTYFEGRGCEMAERSRTKAGHRNKWAIGIVLLATERGFPLRWQVVSGKTKDPQAMGEMADKLKKLTWIRGLPFVCDRAMGQESSLLRLLDNKLHFLTAAPVDTIDSHTSKLPHQPFSALELGGTQASNEQDIKLVVQTAREIGLEEVDERLFVLDLGVSDFMLAAERKEKSKSQPVDKKYRRQDIGARLQIARQFRAKLDSGEYENELALARQVGMTKARIVQLLRLLELAPDIQEQLLNYKGELHVPYHRLQRAIKEQDPARQRELLGDVLGKAADKSLDGIPANDQGEAGSSGELQQEDLAATPRRLRRVAYFNPQMFVDQRNRAREHLAELDRFVAELNDELANASQGRKEEPTRRKIMRELESRHYTDVFTISLSPIKVAKETGTQIDSFHCELKLNPKVWVKRRRYDGFVLLLGHPDLAASGKELALLYRAKDVIEKNFETIKSVIELRPIFSHTDPKVQAHVTICILALLLNRVLEHRLRESNMALTAPACAEVLETCHLNRMKRRLAGQGLYSVTEPTRVQQEILEALGLTHLVDDESIAKALGG